MNRRKARKSMRDDADICEYVMYDGAKEYRPRRMTSFIEKVKRIFRKNKDNN